MYTPMYYEPQNVIEINETKQIYSKSDSSSGSTSRW